MVRAIAVVSVLLSAILSGGLASAADPKIATRCDAAERLLADGQRELAVAQLNKALDRQQTRDCAVRALVALQAAPSSEAYTRCHAGDDLRTKHAKDEGTGDDLLDQAKEQYTKALESDTERKCGADGLIAVAKIAKDEAGRDKRLTPREAAREVVDFAAGTAWAWPAGLLIVLALYAIFRLVIPPKRIKIKAAAGDEKFAEQVVEAANGAGGEDAAPAKLAVGHDALPKQFTADVVALLRLPAGAAVAQLLTIPVGWIASRLSVTRSSAGGWEVAEMTLRRPWRTTRSVRIPLRLGALDEKVRQQVLALACGAWLVTVIDDDCEAPPTSSGDDGAARAHACFRAGANRQDVGDPETALACYAAMPDVRHTDAPYAWVGSRLNTMVALKAQQRWAEADLLARAVKEVPQRLLDNEHRVFEFGRPGLEELRRKVAYMSAIVYVDHLAAKPADPHAAEAAKKAVAALDEEIDRPDAKKDYSIYTAMRLVSLCHSILSGQPRALDDVGARMKLAGPASSSIETRRPALGAVAHYDAACAVSLLLARLLRSQAAAEETLEEAVESPDAASEESQHIEEACRLLKLALVANLEERRARVRAMAQADAMLKPLRDRAPTKFADAIGEPPEPEQPDARLAVELTTAAAPATP